MEYHKFTIYEFCDRITPIYFFKDRKILLTKMKNNIIKICEIAYLAFYTKTLLGVAIRSILLIIDILFFILLFLEFNFPDNELLLMVEISIGIIFFIEYIFRCFASYKRNFFGIFYWIRIIDALVIFSIFSRHLINYSGYFLLLFSVVRIFRFYRTIRELYRSNKYLKEHEEVVSSFVNILVFIFVMTSLVFTFQVDRNDKINTYLDAMYFTITTLTTTGFGDIIVVGTEGKVLVIFIMFFGVSLFIQLATKIFTPYRITARCQHCGLAKHEVDASHCKHCGNIINLKSGNN